MRALVPSLIVVVAVLSPVRAEVEILPFDQVQPGMKGTGLTVFHGTEIESFDVEILGKLPNIGPDQNLILARLSGEPLDRTGVLAGMSGSPVVIDGRLVGAVAYTWGFATEAIAGLTPIEEMLALAKADPSRSRRAAGAGERLDLTRLRSPEALRVFFDVLQSRIVSAGPLPRSIPLSVAGVELGSLTRLLPDLTRAGFLPMQTGAAGGSDEPPEPLRPGSAMGLKLVRGDVDMTATGTVTWVEGDQLLALGHPLFGLGAIDLPLTGARVEALLPSLLQSARLARPLGEVGALREDRAAGVLGRLGARPSMIPVRMRLKGSSGSEHDFAFDIADDPLLSPLLLYVSLNGVLAGKERIFGNATLRLEQGSVIKMAGNDDIELDNLYAGPAAFDYGTGVAAYILYLLMNNTWDRPQVAGVNLIFAYEEAPRTARIRRAALDRYRVAAGDAVEVTVVLSPYRGPDQLLTREIVVPAETPPGPIDVTIGGALEVNRDFDYDEPVLPRDLNQLIWLINQLRRNDNIYILATREDSGVLLGGARMPNLPHAVARVLTRPQSRGNFSVIPFRSILEEVVPTEYAVRGMARIRLEVVAR